MVASSAESGGHSLLLVIHLYCLWLPQLQNLMREYMRNNDRALSNIEALPGGFNALRQLYENVQVRHDSNNLIW